MIRSICFGVATAALLFVLSACGEEDIAAVAARQSGTAPGCASGTAIGALCGGGKLFDTAYQGSTYLVMSLTDMVSTKWRVDLNATSNASDTADGRNNTGTFNASHPASQACQDKTEGGAKDWYLPAMAELQSIGNRNASAGLGLNTGNVYWSSNQGVFPSGALAMSNSTSVWAQTEINKDALNTVRCIRRPTVK